MYQTEYLELAIELYDIYSAHDIHHRRWLTARELQRIKGGPGLIAKVKNKKGKMSELQPVFVDYVNTQRRYRSCNTPQQWTCKFDDWLQDKYEFTKEELDDYLVQLANKVPSKSSGGLQLPPTRQKPSK